MLTISPYPNLRVEAFLSTYPQPLGAIPPAHALTAFLQLDAVAPITRSEERRKAIRDLLRHKGYKPTGRGKPASEYLVKAAEKGTLNPINLAVDMCNVVSLHSGFPISVIDADRSTAPYAIHPAAPDATYIFNASGQEIDVEGLLCVHDADGPCANAVKDSQRTKTNEATAKTLTVMWGIESDAAALDQARAWYFALLDQFGATVQSLNP